LKACRHAAARHLATVAVHGNIQQSDQLEQGCDGTTNRLSWRLMAKQREANAMMQAPPAAA